VRHCVARVGEKVTPLMGDVVKSATISPDTKTLWIVDNACAQQMAGPCIAGDDIEGLPDPQVITRAEKTLAPVPGAAPFSNIVFMQRQKLFLGYTVGETKLGVYDLDMVLISVAEAPTPVYSCKMNPVTQELTTGGVGDISAWLWRARRQVLDIRTQIVNKDNVKAKFAGLPINDMVFDDVETEHQRVFAVCDRSILIFDMRGIQLNVFESIHSAPIVTLLYHLEFEMLVTAARDGTIKLWDQLGGLKHAFVGHTREVTSLIRHPYESLIMSSSLDRTIRVWNLQTLDTVLTVTTAEPIEHIGRLSHKLRMFSVSKSGVECWKINTVYCDFAAIGETVISIGRIESIGRPARILALTEKGSTFLVSPLSGQKINSARELKNYISASYSSSLDHCYCLTDASIEVQDAGINPMVAQTSWKAPKGIVYSCLCSVEPQAGFPGSATKCLLLMGTTDGDMVVVNGLTGKQLHFFKKVHTGVTTHIVCNNAGTRIVSFGDDKLVQVWILNPKTEEIKPAQKWYLPLVPKHAAMMNSGGTAGAVVQRLCVVVENEFAGKFPVYVFDTESKRIHKHAPEDDHFGVVTAAAACQTMMWFVTCALDGRVKLWSDKNVLLRELDLYHPVTSCDFLNKRGCLAVGILSHIQQVNIEDFIPDRYKSRYADNMLNATDDVLEHEVVSSIKEDVKFLSPAAGATAKAMKARKDKLLAAAQDRARKREMETQRRQQGHNDIFSRDAELERLAEKREMARREDPELNGRPKRNVRMAAYMKWLYPQPDEAREATEMYKDADEAKLPDMTREEYEKVEKEIALMPVMQSGHAGQLWHQSVAAYCPHSELPPPPLAPDGYIPNSIIWQQMRAYGGEPGVGSVPDGWQPKQMTDEQRNAQVISDAESDGEAGGDLMGLALASDPESEEEEEDDEEPVVEKRKRTRAPQTPSNFNKPDKPVSNKFKRLEKAETPPRTPTPEPEPEVKPPTPPPTPPPPPPPDSPPPKPAAPAEEKRPALPRYITMFRGAEWFDALYPRAISKTFDFLRPHGPVDNVWPQITLTDWLTHLASSDMEQRDGGIGFTGQRKGLIWKSKQGTLDSKHFDGMLSAINKLASDDSVRPLFGIQDIQLISTTILEVLRASRRAAEVEKEDEARRLRRKKRAKKRKDGKLAAHPEVPGGEDADGNVVFPAPTGEATDSEGGTTADEVGDTDEMNPEQLRELRAHSMVAIDTLTQLRVTTKESVSEILLMQSVGNEKERLFARKSLMSLGLEDPQDLLMKSLTSVVENFLTESGVDPSHEKIRRRTSLNQVGHFLGDAMSSLGAKKWRDRMSIGGGDAVEDEEECYVDAVNYWVKLNEKREEAALEEKEEEVEVVQAKLERMILPQIKTNTTVPRIGYMRFKPGSAGPIRANNLKWPGTGDGDVRSQKATKLELRPHFFEPTPHLETSKDMSKDAKPFSLFNSGRYFNPAKSWAD